SSALSAALQGSMLRVLPLLAALAFAPPVQAGHRRHRRLPAGGRPGRPLRPRVGIGADMANREDVSWVALRDESGSGVLFAVLGLGGASCGPIPIERDIVKAGAAHHF